MILSLILAAITGVTCAPGWSDPVITIEVPAYSLRKDLVVTEGNHIHQIWGDYQNEPLIGYNQVLPDGTVLLEDTLFSRNVYSGYPSMSYASDSSVIGFWRENVPKWYSVRDSGGGILISPTFYSGEGWSLWTRIDSSLDSLGRVHMVWDSGPEVCYSILEPGVGEVWRDTIPDSWQQSLILVDENRVHIKFNGPDQWADYIQYDLDGNVTVPRVSLVEDILGESNWCSMAVDSFGNVYLFVFENPDGQPGRFRLYKVDGSSGEIMIDGKDVYLAPSGKMISDPIILSCPFADWFYLLWLEDDPVSSFPKLIKFAVIDTDGEFIVEPYIAYDYSDEDPEQLEKLAATTNQQGDVFIIYSEGDPEISAYWIRLGWFDHSFLGIGEDPEAPITTETTVLRASENPFSETVEITATSELLPGQLAVYDLSGRCVRTLFNGGEGVFIWDGHDADGDEVPSGSYIIRGIPESAAGSLSLIKL